MKELERFLRAQEDMYHRALAELREGEKRSHWIWYIFPQLQGLGSSAMAQLYGIRDLAEARAYLAHPVLGERLITCCEALLVHKDKTAEEILGAVDALKLRSSMTLFALVSEENSVFYKMLEQFYEGQKDPITLAGLGLSAKR
ncbi:MAG: DUF1810 domain-containing protein [Oscillospiraceae bacterium]|nr:DUF1810 domain-containing protein [Oscillospiraceae bacterium]